jgi:hypothetical protein
MGAGEQGSSPRRAGGTSAEKRNRRDQDLQRPSRSGRCALFFRQNRFKQNRFEVSLCVPLLSNSSTH